MQANILCAAKWKFEAFLKILNQVINIYNTSFD